MSATAFQRMRREAARKAAMDSVEKVIPEVKLESEDTPAEDVGVPVDFDTMEIEELINYAKEHNIDLGKSTSKNGILKKIEEAEKDNGTGDIDQS